jgi:hypothetical protein
MGGFSGNATGGSTGQGGFGNAGSAGLPSSGGSAGTEAGTGQGGESGTSTGGGAATGGSVGASGSGEGGEAGTGPGQCKPGLPSAGCTLGADEPGIYVALPSAGGDDANQGTQSAPVASLAHAVVLAAPDRMPIFVCAGTYKEHVLITTSGLSFHGAYSCTGAVWTYDPTKYSRVMPSTKDEALRVKGAHGLDVADMEFVSQNATVAGASSIAVFVSDSDGVTFTRAHVVAGNGMKGADGTMVPFVYQMASALHGQSATSDTGADPNDCTCDASSEHSKGARGGDAGQDGGTGEPDLGGGLPGTHGSPCTNGGLGFDAPTTDDGPGAQTSGSLSADGWLPTSGTDATNGRPGQGGGGGGGGKMSGDGGGGGGACGGCGGKGGGGGAGGGASIAFLSFNSTLTLTDCVIETSTAGAGGNGAAGQPGQNGGVGGDRFHSACVGGNGGMGGKGGAGGGGSGGISAGIVSKAGTIKIDDHTNNAITTGAPGAAGLGAGMANDGQPGVAKNALEL